MQDALTAEDATEVLAVIVEIVSSLNEADEQSTGNLDILMVVYSQIGDLVSSGQLNVTEDVRMNTAYININFVILIHDISYIANWKYSKCVEWYIWMATWGFRRTIFIVRANDAIQNRWFIVFFYNFSMVKSFETVASSLVSGDDFTGFDFVENQLTINAARVSDNTILVIIVYLSIYVTLPL